MPTVRVMSGKEKEEKPHFLSTLIKAVLTNARQ